MKVIESQSAVLTNFEVYHHLTTRPLGSRKVNKRGPKDFESLKEEVIQYLETTPNPLAQKPISYTTSSIKELVTKLHPYDLSKGEMIMIFNIRPVSIAALNTIIEDMEERFDEQQQVDIVTIIAEVLGQFPPDHKLVAENGAS